MYGFCISLAFRFFFIGVGLFCVVWRCVYLLFPQHNRFIYLQAFGQLMRDEQDSDFTFEQVDGVGKLICGVLVEVAGGLIKNQDLRLSEQ